MPTVTTQVVNYVPADYDLTEVGSGIYTDYEIEISYEWDQHVLQLPVASATVTTASFAYLASPTLRKVVRWTAEKLGSQPSVPVAETNDPNEVLLRKLVQPTAPKIMPDGNNRIWRCSGKYEYGVADPSKVVLSGGALPLLKGTFKDATITGFTHGIIDQQADLGFFVKP